MSPSIFRLFLPSAAIVAVESKQVVAAAVSGAAVTADGGVLEPQSCG